MKLYHVAIVTTNFRIYGRLNDYRTSKDATELLLGGHNFDDTYMLLLRFLIFSNFDDTLSTALRVYINLSSIFIWQESFLRFFFDRAVLFFVFII